MALLESAMAFAVVMMIFSTIVTGIVEAILKAVGTREKNLQRTINALFDKVIWPRLNASLERINPQVPEQTDKTTLVSRMPLFSSKSTTEGMHKAIFLKDLTQNPVFDPPDKLEMGRKSKIDSLSILSFAERLGRTDVGKAIAAESEAQMELLVQDMARSFDRFSRASSEVFRKKAQLTAICVAIPFAWFANIDASRLLGQLLENPEIRTGFIEQAEEYQQENAEAVQRLKELQDEIEKLQQEGSAGSVNEDENPDTGTLQQQFKDVSEQVKQSLSKLEAQGLAIGWHLYPFCAEANIDAACDGRAGWKDKNGNEVGFLAIVCTIVGTGDFYVWLLMTSLAGVLIGLGGPFWYKVFSGFSQLFQVMRALGLGGSKSKKEEPSAPPEKTAEDSAKPKDVLDAFKIAVAANTTTSPITRGRAVLGPDGNPL